MTLTPVTLILDVDLDTTKRYLSIKNEVSRSRHSKVEAQTGYVVPVTLALTR